MLLVKSSHSAFKHFLFLACLTVSVTLSGCINDELQIPDKELGGQIGGNVWEYGLANAFRQGAQYEFKFLSAQESVRNACDLPFPGSPHVKALLSPSIGSFVVSQAAIDPNQVQVAFELGGGKTITANNGFLEIFDISGGEIVGYLQAEEGDNQVEGSFQLQICN